MSCRVDELLQGLEAQPRPKTNPVGRLPDWAAMARRFSGGARVAVFLARAHAARNARHRCGGGPDAPRWLVAVNMVSEGVDVPRLILAVYATAKRTDLFFRQAVGRVVRCRAAEPDDLEATVFLPADEALKACAERVEVKLRQEVRDQIDAAFDVEAPHAVGRRRDFEPLDAEVQAGGMIVAGVHYRRDEVEAARRLLRELGQPERALRSVLESCGENGSAPDGRPTARERRTAPDRRPTARERRTARDTDTTTRRGRGCQPLSQRSAGSTPSGARWTAWLAAGLSCVARSTRSTPGHRRRLA